MIVDYDSLEKHLSVLQELYKEPIHCDRPGPFSEEVYRFPLREGATRYTHHESLPDDRIVAVADDGPEALSDRELAALLLNPVALIDLYRTIDELSPEAWHQAWHEAGKDLVDTESGSTRPFRSGRVRAYGLLARASALAASLLIGISIGSRVFRDQGDAAGPSSWPVDASLLSKGARGDLGSRQIEIRSKLDGFATIIELIPGERPEVTPGAGGELIRVKPGSPTESPPLPPSSKGSPVALIVVTATPSDADIRRALRGRIFSPDEIDQLRSFVETKLRELNHRAIGFTRVVIPTTPD
jgi:hypothetical protein